MRKLATFGLVGVLAIAGVGLSSAPSDATHRYRSGVSIGLSFGPPQYYYDYPTYYSYRPYRAYSYSYVPRRQVIVTGGNVHVAWCQNRYRSYRAWDNTFQPYYGPRRECISPYWG